MADWSTRTATLIHFKSPGGTKLSAKWKGDIRSFDKNIQRDAFPLIAGEYGKDLGSGAEEYPLTFYFDGVACDIAADTFFQKCKELGIWEVSHPVYGVKKLLLLRVREANDPVGSGGVIKVETAWMEPLDPMAMMTTLQMLGMLNTAIMMFPIVILPVFAALIIPSGWGGLGAIIGMANLIGAIAGQLAEESWATITNPVALEQAQGAFNQANQDLINATSAPLLDTDDFDPAGIGGAVFDMMYATSMGAEDTETAMQNLDNAADQMIAAFPSGSFHTRPEDANRSYTSQLGLEATVASACLAHTFTNIKTRTQAVEAAQALGAMFTKIVTAFDVTQQEFSTLRGDQQYYAQTASYDALFNIVSMTIKYLLKQTFELAVEKKITLDRDKTPIQICFEEFGSTGESKIDDFIEWNQLEGDEIIFLKSGREVVIYLEAQ